MNENLNFMDSYNYHPKTREELRNLIKQRIKITLLAHRKLETEFINKQIISSKLN